MKLQQKVILIKLVERNLLIWAKGTNTRSHKPVKDTALRYPSATLLTAVESASIL